VSCDADAVAEELAVFCRHGFKAAAEIGAIVDVAANGALAGALSVGRTRRSGADCPPETVPPPGTRGSHKERSPIGWPAGFSSRQRQAASPGGVMAKFRGPNQGRKLVWRITAYAPLGEFVDPGAELPPVAAVRGEAGPGGWVLSSFDLMHGVEVREDGDTVPGELCDALFSFPEAAPKPDDPA